MTRALLEADAEWVRLRQEEAAHTAVSAKRRFRTRFIHGFPYVMSAAVIAVVMAGFWRYGLWHGARVFFGL